MKHMLRRYSLSTLLLAFVLTSSVAAEAEDDFQQLFGDEIKRVKSTRSDDDNLALAKRMLESAATLKADEPILVPLFTYVYEQGRKSEASYAMALEAMERLGKQFPAKAKEAGAKAIALLKVAYLRSRGDERLSYAAQIIEKYDSTGKVELSRGDHRAALLAYREALKVARAVRSASVELMQARLELSTERLAADRRLELIDKKIAAPPVDPKVKQELVTLCIAKLNDPNKAAGYALILDEAARTRITLAAKPVEQVDLDGCAALGNWYADIAKAERKLIKLALLERAQAYLARFLSLSVLKEGQPETVAHLKVTLSLKRVKAEIDKLQFANQDDGANAKWVNLEPLFAKAVANRKWNGPGTVTYKGGVFELEGKKTRLVAPIESADVIVSAEFKKISGQFLSIAGRITDTNSYWTQLAPSNTLTMNRWTKSAGPLELQRVVVNGAFAGKFAKVQLAILGDTLITYVNGKEVLRAKNKDVEGAGQVGFGVNEAKAQIKNPRYMIPSPELTKRLLAGSGKP